MSKKPAFAALLLALLATVVCSSGAYALNVGGFRDEVNSVVRRLVGDDYHAEYQGTDFTYPKSRQYSDAAIKAYAELDNIGYWHYLYDNPTSTRTTEYVDGAAHQFPYEYPLVGRVQCNPSCVDPAGKVVVQALYQLGDKANSSHQVQQSLSLLSSEVVYRDGEKLQATSDLSTGDLVWLKHQQVLRHQLGSGQAPEVSSNYYMYKLHQPIEAYVASDWGHVDTINKEAAPYLARHSKTAKPPAQMACMDDPRDICHFYTTEDDLKAQSLYAIYMSVAQRTGSDSKRNLGTWANPHHQNAGEALPDDAVQPPLIMTNIQGKISQLTTSSIEITASSGTKWTFAYNAENQQQFAELFHRPLKVGDYLDAFVYRDLNNLDANSFADDRIMTISRR